MSQDYKAVKKTFKYLIKPKYGVKDAKTMGKIAYMRKIHCSLRQNSTFTIKNKDINNLIKPQV